MDEREEVRVVERHAAREELVRDDAEGVDVRAPRERRVLLGEAEELGRHELGRPRGRAVLAALGALDAAREPEVRDDHAEPRADQDVRGLDVAVERARLVDRGETTTNLIQHADRLRGGKRRPALLLHPPIEARSFDVLHREVGRARDLAVREDLDDVRMTHAGHRARFGEEAPAAVLVEREVRADQLDRDVALEAQVAREQDDAHAALAEPAVHAIAVVYQRAWHRAHRKAPCRRG